MEPVEIDESGVYKYVLIQLYLEDGGSQWLVRGHAWGEYHDDIYQRTLSEALAKGLDTECVGGGRIRFDPEKKDIYVYGYSVGYGRADHTRTVQLIQRKYLDYNVHWSNEGY